MSVSVCVCACVRRAVVRMQRKPPQTLPQSPLKRFRERGPKREPAPTEPSREGSPIVHRLPHSSLKPLTGELTAQTGPQSCAGSHRAA